MKKNFILTFIAACVPGCGQMYYGYMKRGLSLLLLMAAVFSVIVVTNTEALIAIFPVIWFFSFFDTYNIRNFSAEKREQTSDKFVFSDFGITASKLTINGNKWLGIGLVVFGLFVFYNTTLSRFIYMLVNEYGLYWLSSIFNAIPSICVALILVLLGAHLIKNSLPKKDEIVEFKGATVIENNDSED